MYLEVKTNLCFFYIKFNLHINFRIYKYQVGEYQFIFYRRHKDYHLLFGIFQKLSYHDHSYYFMPLMHHLIILIFFEILEAFEQL